LLTPIITDRKRVASVVNKSTQLKIIHDEKNFLVMHLR